MSLKSVISAVSWENLEETKFKYLLYNISWYMCEETEYISEIMGR